MKNNKKGFTLIELLAVIVILAIVMVLAVTTILPYIRNARRDAFLTDATSVVAAANDAVGLEDFKRITVTSDGTASCKANNKMCFTVDELKKLGLLEIPDSYAGYVNVEVAAGSNDNAKIYEYTLYLNKSSEFSIAGVTKKVKSEFTKDDLAESANDYSESTCSCTTPTPTT